MKINKIVSLFMAIALCCNQTNIYLVSGEESKPNISAVEDQISKAKITPTSTGYQKKFGKKGKKENNLQSQKGINNTLRNLTKGTFKNLDDMLKIVVSEKLEELKDLKASLEELKDVEKLKALKASLLEELKDLEELESLKAIFEEVKDLKELENLKASLLEELKDLEELESLQKELDELKNLKLDEKQDLEGYVDKAKGFICKILDSQKKLCSKMGSDDIKQKIDDLKTAIKTESESAKAFINDHFLPEDDVEANKILPWFPYGEKMKMVIKFLTKVKDLLSINDDDFIKYSTTLNNARLLRFQLLVRSLLDGKKKEDDPISIKFLADESQVNYNNPQIDISIEGGMEGKKAIICISNNLTDEKVREEIKNKLAELVSDDYCDYEIYLDNGITDRGNIKNPVPTISEEQHKKEIVSELTDMMSRKNPDYSFEFYFLSEEKEKEPGSESYMYKIQKEKFSQDQIALMGGIPYVPMQEMEEQLRTHSFCYGKQQSLRVSENLVAGFEFEIDLRKYFDNNEGNIYGVSFENIRSGNTYRDKKPCKDSQPSRGCTSPDLEVKKGEKIIDIECKNCIPSQDLTKTLKKELAGREKHADIDSHWVFINNKSNTWTFSLEEEDTKKYKEALECLGLTDDGNKDRLRKDAEQVSKRIVEKNKTDEKSIEQKEVKEAKETIFKYLDQKEKQEQSKNCIDQIFKLYSETSDSGIKSKIRIFFLQSDNKLVEVKKKDASSEDLLIEEIHTVPVKDASSEDLLIEEIHTEPVSVAAKILKVTE